MEGGKAPLTFSMQIGLVRESVTVEGGELTIATLKEIACAFVDRKSPEHGFYGLQDKLLLFLHLQSDPNLLKLIDNPALQVREGALVEVVLSASTTMDELQVRPHVLFVHSYKSPHFCDFCGEMLFGLVRQGLKCDGCGMNFHKRCAYKIPNNCTCNKRRSACNPTVNGGDSPAALAHHGGSATSLTSLTSRENRSKSWSGRPLWLEKEYQGRIKVPHTFVVHNYKKPTVCQLCKKLLKGLFRQGVQCKDCKFNCHKKCVQQVAKDCQGEVKWLPGDGEDRQSLYSSASIPYYDSGDADSIPDTDTLPEEDASAASESVALDDDDDDTQEKPPLSPSSSSNIPLMRVVQSVRHTKRGAGAKVIREGWLVHYTDRDNTALMLNEILKMDTVRKEDAADPARCPHVFEMHTPTCVYYVGEDPSRKEGSDAVHSPESGVGLETALVWENAVRQALLPVTPQHSVEGENNSSAPASETTLVFKQDISTLYQIFPDDVLGSGQFGIVYGGRHRKSNREVAIKVIDKLRFPTKQEAQLKNEVAILQIYVVMEKLKGDMLEMILSSPRGRLSERVTKFLVSQIVTHSGVKRLTFVAPEVLKSKGYNRSLDMWSVGVIIYVSLSGTFPFNEDEEISDQIQNAAFMYPAKPWKEISPEAVDVVRRLLVVDMNNRLSVSSAFRHRWIDTDYQTWCDMRKLESQVGQRYLTHESDDARWDAFRTQHKLEDWSKLGHRGVDKGDVFNFNKIRQAQGSTAR